MQILIVNSGLRYGGTETQIIALSKELVRRGHQITIYTLTNDVPRLAELDSSGVDIVVDNKRCKLDLGVLRRLRGFIRAYHPDLLHGFLYDGNIYTRVAAIGLDVPVLNSERNDNYTLRSSQVWPHRLTKQLTDGVIANTWAGKDFAQSLFNLPDDRVHVVWNGMDLGALHARIKKCEENYRALFYGGAGVRLACFVGSLLPSKDYLLALKVADRLTRRDNHWRVLFIGDSIRESSYYNEAAAETNQHYRDQVQECYQALNLQDRALFIGQRADALEILAQCDVLFSTSRHEGFPNIVLEAMSVGVPVVAVDYSDIRRILPVNWQVTERIPEALVQTILRAAEMRESIAIQQIEWVRDNATIEHAAKTLESFYRLYVEQ